MNTPDPEALSALVDGEVDGKAQASLLDALAADPALRATWSRYQLIGTAIRRGVPDVHDPDLPTRVQALVGDSLPDGELDVDLLAPEPTVATAPRWRRATSGLAMAASVAAVALFGVSQFGAAPEGPGLVAGMNAPAPVGASAAQPVAQREPGADPAELDHARLVEYLQRHHQFASAGGMRGLPADVRVVSQEGYAGVR